MDIGCRLAIASRAIREFSGILYVVPTSYCSHVVEYAIDCELVNIDVLLLTTESQFLWGILKVRN